MGKKLKVGVVAGGFLVLAACSGRAPGPSAPAAKSKPVFQVVASTSCARVNPGVGPARHGAVRQSSTVALAKVPQGALLAYIADSDEPTLHTVDLDQGRELAATDLKGTPEHVLVLADGRVAVTLRNQNQIEVLEPGAQGTLQSRCVVDTPVEPIAMAVSPDEQTLLVTSAWAHKVTAFEPVNFAQKFEVDVGREPRAVVVAEEGDRAFVAHLVNATMSVIDLKGEKHEVRTMPLGTRKIDLVGNTQRVDPKIRRGCQGYALTSAVDPTSPGETLPPVVGEKPPAQINPPAPSKPTPARPQNPTPENPKTPAVLPGRLFAPFVTVDPGDERITYYGTTNDTVNTEINQISVIDTAAERVLTKTALSVRTASMGPTRECLLPRSVSFHNGSLYTTCLGIDALVEYDARGVDPARTETRRWAVPAGPTGVAIDGPGKRAVIWSQFDRAVSLVKLDSEDEPVLQMALSRKAGHGLSTEASLGRVLYHKTGDGRVSAEGMACASCHPDGREDAITWSSTDGPRNTPMLAGRMADTAPYSWQGNHETVEIHLEDTVRRLRGRGLSKDEIHAIAEYVRALPGPNLKAKMSTEQQQLVEQGKAIFASSETACATCHTADKAFTDGQKYDVRAQSGNAKQLLDTPSLRFLGGTAPYFHDGRYATLQAMLEASDHAMGHTLHLSREQRLALTAYLESL
jgi:DNA-binding beta-propeller fold protein YncE/mono/diheme cytochrome c family protein